MFSIATAPAKQSVSETISVLSGRLGSATLLEDRRAAILGLRSFAKEYPASVASGALRSLIGSLAKDGEDVDTVKVVLETLLMLFNPNEDSPEASEEIALWLADEFTQRQENITLLLDFLETNDFYSRLYSLQLLSAILAARTERTEECVLTAPLGISRLVSLLDDPRDAIRNEAITLLTYLTPTSSEIQKLVAFENAFDRLFRIIETEGSVMEGGRVIEDCLILLANLLRVNAPNQSLFRETGFVPQLAKLLESTHVQDGGEGVVSSWAQAQQNRNIYALLAVIRLFLVTGAPGTAQNQAIFWQQGVLYHTLQLAFGHDGEIPIKAEALAACADAIRGNSDLQENFAQLQVPSPLEEREDGPGVKTNGVAHANVYVIDGLLDMTLSMHAAQAFDMRMAACECLKAYFFNHADARLHFLRRAIEGHNSGADETANVFTTLLRSPLASATSDPYRFWFAAVIMLHLLYENPSAKSMAMAVTEGDEASGEEVVTSIQTITAHLVTSLARDEDPRLVIGYLMLLICWLFEDLDGVNDFLGEGSNLQGLIQAVLKNTGSETITQGLCAALLGVVYEFSTKDSPIPRATLQSILLGRMGRDRFVDKLNRLRCCPWLRDFEVLPQRLDMTAGQKLPDVYFDATFVEFFKDNYGRIVRAIDRDPGMEVSVVANGVQKGISREMVDSLRAEVDEKTRTLKEVQATMASLESLLAKEQAEHKRTRDNAAVEAVKARAIAESLQRQQAEEISKIRAEHQKDRAELQRQMEHVQKAADAEAARIQRRSEAEVADLRATTSRLEVDLMKAKKSKTQELQAARERFESKLAEQEAATAEAQTRARELEKKLEEAESKSQELQKALEEAEDGYHELQKKLERGEGEIKKVEALRKQTETEKQTAQSELDDLLMVFGDLEEKAAKYKARLKALGQEVSDAEDDEAGDEDEEEEEDANSDVD